MSRQRLLSSNEKLAFVLFGILALLGLMGMLFGVLAPTGSNGQIEPQTGALCLGPFFGALGAMALIWLRQRTGKPSFALVGAIVMWFMGVTLLGLGIFNAFNPGDNTLLENFGYSIALCFAPGLVFSLLAIGAYWYSELRPLAQAARDAQDAEALPEVLKGAQPGAGGYDDIERRARDYRRRITALIRQRKNGPLKDALLPVLDEIEAWEGRICQLTGWLAAFESDTTMQRDLRETPAAIDRLQNQLLEENDPEVQAQMNETLAGYREQQAHLGQLRSAARQVRLKLDEALSAMGLIYSQLQLLSVKELDKGSARRISEDIQEQTERLDDMLLSVGEVYSLDQSTPESPGHGAPARGRQDAAAGA